MRLYIFFLFSVDCELKHLIKHNSLFLEKIASLVISPSHSVARVLLRHHADNALDCPSRLCVAFNKWFAAVLRNGRCFSRADLSAHSVAANVL